MNKPSPESLATALALGRPIHLVMRQFERSIDFIPVVPGEVPWLSPLDWSDRVVVSHNHRTVRLVALDALNPGTGAFRRLVERIMAHGMSPVVCEPSPHMVSILRHWGWRRRTKGFGWKHEERWMPRRGWTPPVDSRPPDARRS